MWNSSFILKLDINLNIIVRKYQIYLLTHNTIYYKYDNTIISQYKFNFSCLINN